MKPRQPFRPNLQPIVGKNGKVVPIKLVKDPSIGSGLTAHKDMTDSKNRPTLKLKKEPAKTKLSAQPEPDQDMLILS